MVAIEADQHAIHLTIPTEGMPPEEVSLLVNWLRAEVVARRSKLTDAAARQLADEVNSGWWERNKARFVSETRD